MQQLHSTARSRSFMTSPTIRGKVPFKIEQKMSATMQSRLVELKGQKRCAMYDSIIDTIGRTPIIKLSSKINPFDDVNVYVKCESENPGGSVKDRLAYGIIEWAEKHGHLRPGQTVVEASSGNTGIGLALVCACKGYPFVCVMSESYSIERRKQMRFLGARVVLTKKDVHVTGMVMKAKELATEHGFFLANQFESEANAWIHEQTTGVEITEAFEEGEKQLNHVVVPYGTGGTLLGVSRVVRKKFPSVMIHACEPSNAPMLYSGIETNYPSDGYPSTSFDSPHPLWNPHLIQGWAADFIPKIVGTARDTKAYDDIILVQGSDAIKTSQKLAINDGIFSGISGGGVLWAALQVAERASKGTNILAIIADTGQRYLSTALFENIPVHMSSEEMYLDVTTPSEAPPPPPLPVVPSEIRDYVTSTIQANTVIIWSLKYCELCWGLKNFMDELGIPYKCINIDSIEFARENKGNKFRVALQEMTNSTKFPFFFLQGEYLGDLMDVLTMWKQGRLEPLLISAKLNPFPFNGDPFEFLPNWIDKSK